jgi:hypothetical protein
MLHSSLCLLVLLAPVDDAWALAAPEPGGSAWAAANNEFLSRVGNGSVALAPEPGGGPGWPGRAPEYRPPAPAAARAGPDLLYLLMSLQR